MAGDWSMAFGLVLAGLLVALSALLLLAAWQSRNPQSRPSIFDQGPSRVAFLFDGERLLDASPAARLLLPEGEELLRGLALVGHGVLMAPVSYTHLTLPTSDLV